MITSNRKRPFLSNVVRTLNTLVIILLLIFSVNLSAASSTSIGGNVVLPYDSVGLIDLPPYDTCHCPKKIDYTPPETRSYDPHSQLLYFKEMEAGRITFYMDAYYGHDLKIEIQNVKGEKVMEKRIESVELQYFRVDLAAWECGDYYVLLVNGHGEVEQYSFVID